jgi:3D (Asp-Asp-Asp) domain-containing protein
MMNVKCGFFLLVAVVALLPQACAAHAQDSGHDKRIGSELGKHKLTYYWIAFEKNFNEPPTVPLYDKDGNILATVGTKFAKAVTLEGTGVLQDGRVVNLMERCTHGTLGWCFFEVNKKVAPYGYGSKDPLRPFRTLAVPEEIIPSGTVVYAPMFDGMPLPSGEGGFEYHDGCFVVEDTGWSLKGRHIDMFALAQTHYETLHKATESKEEINLFVNSPLCPPSAKALYDPAAWAEEISNE